MDIVINLHTIFYLQKNQVVVSKHPMLPKIHSLILTKIVLSSVDSIKGKKKNIILDLISTGMEITEFLTAVRAY